MKKYTSTIILLLFMAVFTTCKKEPDAPTGTNKIEIGQTAADSVGYFAAKVSTTITSTGGNQITQHGHCWSIQSKPTTDDAKTSLGTLNGSGTYTSQLTGLQDNTTYYLRPYFTYAYVTVYGKESNIKTLITGKPTVHTIEVTDVKSCSAKCSGNVLTDNGLFVTTRGVCWNTSGNPTLQNNTGYTIDGSGTGTFISELTGLTKNTTYYVTAYASNEKGTGYGEARNFKTHKFNTPIVTTAIVSEITNTSAVCGGEVSGDNIGTISGRGVCWNTTGNPTLQNNTGYTTDGSGTGTFISELTGLTKNTTYYVVAYATNEKGTAYGQTESFVTTNDLIDSRDGQTYKTIVIGSQTWMAENLNYETSNSWWYNNSSANGNVYGRLYTWDAALSACPSGWHVPSDAEWTVLTDYLGGESVAGGKMKEAGYEHWNSPNTGATNSSGFTALPGGFRNSGGSFYGLGYYGRWWSSTERSGTLAWDRGLACGYDQVGRDSYNKTGGFSVRCLKD